MNAFEMYFYIAAAGALGGIWGQSWVTLRLLKVVDKKLDLIIPQTQGAEKADSEGMSLKKNTGKDNGRWPQKQKTVELLGTGSFRRGR